MAPVVESVAVGRAQSAATVNVTKPTGTAAGDLLVAVHVMDADSPIASMTAPAGWALAGVKDPVAYISFVKIWSKVAGGSEPASYDFGAGTSSETLIAVHRISGAHPDSPLDIAPVWADGGEVTATAQPAPSGTATVDGVLLLCVWAALTEGAAATYTPPGGMTERSDHPIPSDVWIKMATASELLTAAGATGTRTATSTLADRWLAGTLGIAPEPPPESTATVRVHHAVLAAPTSPRVRIHHAELHAAETVRVRIHHAELSAGVGSLAAVRIHNAALTVPALAGEAPPSGVLELEDTYRNVEIRELVNGEWV